MCEAEDVDLGNTQVAWYAKERAVFLLVSPLHREIKVCPFVLTHAYLRTPPPRCRVNE